MAGIAIEGRRVAAGGAAVGGAAAKAPTARAGTVKLVSTVKFLRLLNMHPAKVEKRQGQQQQMGVGTIT